jgi:PAS domain S-box-containing protein
VTRPLRVLCLEDRAADYELILHALSLPGFELFPLRVETENEYINHLQQFDPHVIIADYKLPSYDGLSALEAARRLRPDIPFIFFSGTLGEEVAIEALKHGATDYVLKHKLFRLRPAVERAVREWDETKKLKQAESKLRDSEALYHSLVENLPQNIYRIDVSGRFTFANQQFCLFLGKPAKQIIGKTFYDLYPSAIADQFVRSDREVMGSGSFMGSVQEITFPEGEKRFIRLIRSPLCDDRQQNTGIQGIFWDITEHHLSENRIRHLNQLLYSIRTINRLIVRERDPRKLLNDACGILVQTRGYELVWVGEIKEGSKRVHPVAWAGLRARDYLDSIHVTWDDSLPGRGPIGSAIRNLVPSVINNIASDRDFAPWRAAALERGYGSVAALPLIDGKRACGAIAVYFDHPDAFDSEELDLLGELAGDLSLGLQNIANEEQRKRAEEKLTIQSRTLIESELRYRELFENANDIIYTLDLDGNFTSVNKIGQQTSEFSYEQIMQLNIDKVVAPDYLFEAREILRRTISGESLPPAKLVILSQRGRHITIEVSNRLIMQDGKPVGVQGIARDLTERNQLQEQLLQAQKLEAVGRLAGGIAHDFNNLLTIIIGNSDLLLDSVPESAPAHGDIDQIKKAGMRAADLASKLLAFSRKQILQPKAINLNALIQENSKLLRRIIGEDIDLIVRADPRMGCIKADATQMEQIIMNLAVNAKDAMAKGGKFTIETASVELDEAFVARNPGSHCGRFVVMSATDTGTGMDRETQSHLFEPFFTTKEAGKGTGLGLATVYGIVSQSGGYITVESEPGCGATFKVYLPQVDENPVMEPPQERRNSDGTETILLVEDMDEVRSLARRALRERGYTVLEASDGVSALRIAQQYPGPIHLLITDLIMPGGMNGSELANRFEIDHPGIKILLISGYSSGIEVDALNPGVGILVKPFTGASLSASVRAILQSNQLRV